MKAIAVLALAAASLVSAAPADVPGHSPGYVKTTEEVTVTDFLLHKHVKDGKDSIDTVSFKLSGKDTHDIQCNLITSYPQPQPDRKNGECPGSKFTFQIVATGPSAYKLYIDREVAAFSALMGNAQLPINCHAGGPDADAFDCGVADPVQIHIENP